MTGKENILIDALISAGHISEQARTAIEKLKAENAELRHRAEVAERALKDRATYCATYCVMEDMDWFSLTSVAIEARAKELYKSWRRKAEKDLAEGK